MHHSSALQACIAPHACTSLKISQQQREPARPVPIRRRERCGGRAQPTGVPSDDFRHCGHGGTPFRTAMPIYTAGFSGGSRRGGSPASCPFRLRPSTFCTKRRKTVPTPSVSPVRRRRRPADGMPERVRRPAPSFCKNSEFCKPTPLQNYGFCRLWFLQNSDVLQMENAHLRFIITRTSSLLPYSCRHLEFYLRTLP